MALDLLPDITLFVYGAAFGVVFFAAIVQSTIGMGFGQVAAPMLLLINPDFVPIPILLMGMTVASMNAVKGRHLVVPKDLGVALAGRVLGSIAAGMVLFALVDQSAFPLLFAGLLLPAIAISLSGWKVAPTPITLMLAGTASGFMGTITSVGAPPMGIVYQNSPGPTVRATLNAFFAFGTVASLASLAWFDLLHLHHVTLAVILAPALVAGTWISKHLTAFVDQRFRTLVLGICVISVLMILQDALV